MSAEKPEVGDIWRPKNNEYSKAIVTYFSIEFDTVVVAVIYAGVLQKIKKYHKKYFLKNYVYIGHSKASIKDLFEVE